MAKGAYVGIETEIPIYDTETVNVTADNIGNVFTVTNGSAYYFAGSGDTFTTNNGGVNSSTATTTLTALKDMNVSFTYSYSSEASYDKFTLKIAGNTIENAVSGAMTTKTWSGSLTSGQTIEFTYAKDRSNHSNDDKCTFSGMTCVTAVQTGTTTKSLARKVKKGYLGIDNVARKVKKAYIGIGGVARPCWSGGELAYYGKLSNLPVTRYDWKTANVGGYGLLCGGTDGVTSTDDSGVYAYDESLTLTKVGNLSGTVSGTVNVDIRSEVSIPNYAIFPEIATASVDAFDASLTKHTAVVSGFRPAVYDSGCQSARAVDKAVVAGSDNDTTKTSYCIDSSLVRSNVTRLTTVRSDMGNESTNSYAIFAGGFKAGSSTRSNEVIAYDENMTLFTLPTLSKSKANVISGRVTDHAIFGGGKSSTTLYSDVEAFDDNLTKTFAMDLSVARSSVHGISNGSICVIGGGRLSNSDESDAVDVYDNNLVRTSAVPLSQKRYRHASLSVGNYFIFGGGTYHPEGSSSNTITNDVEAYVFD